MVFQYRSFEKAANLFGALVATPTKTAWRAPSSSFPTTIRVRCADAICGCPVFVVGGIGRGGL
jgi:hypothetical protein